MFFLFLTGLKSPTRCVFSLQVARLAGTKGAFFAVKKTAGTWGSRSGWFLWGTKCFFAK